MASVRWWCQVEAGTDKNRILTSKLSGKLLLRVGSFKRGGRSTCHVPKIWKIRRARKKVRLNRELMAPDPYAHGRKGVPKQRNKVNLNDKERYGIVVRCATGLNPLCDEERYGVAVHKSTSASTSPHGLAGCPNRLSPRTHLTGCSHVWQPAALARGCRLSLRIHLAGGGA